MTESKHPTDAELDKAIDLFSKIVEAASASNHAGEIAIMKAWRAYHSHNLLLAALEALLENSCEHDDDTAEAYRAAAEQARAALAQAEGRS